ncbi:isocitrate lyase/PEP mutase family protein [Bailinhaonella thermotolerans]|uniref:Isocitrate lyase/phosphoenolpyruvate mutase family protein n=1 Tax=Bailinhaonella thermotolerans TaxID=1070861 RepID=A0A3A4A4M7_9ACTN|nr:isocitrate lyase/phosphoenolpyruvate mutase family protein [Bailinhaonella thermotolerans]RJL22709.1 isocitrate lyase/phosphoenolpyruvate mutase family protein [Bailinhaonella thermotolerans]
MNSQIEKARAFRALHVPGTPLALANAWDAGSAAVIAASGAAAVATTSAGVAWSLGAGDGGRLTREAAVGAVQRICAVVGVPVTADIEDGYGEDADAVAVTVREVIAAGAVGVNIEDGDLRGPGPLRHSAEQAARIAAARKAADETGVPLFVNARIDTYLRGTGEASTRLGETVGRARAYLDAGADGIFVPGLIDLDAIAVLVAETAAPVNVMVWPGAPDVAALAGAGVARISLGSGVAQAAYGLARLAAGELAEAGTYGAVAGGVDYGEMNGLVNPAG